MADPIGLRRVCEAAVRTADRPAGRHAVAAAARRPDGRSAGRHFARAQRAGSARRRSCSAGSRDARRPAPRARLAACSRQCRARVRRDRCRRALLDRHRMAERRLGHHLCRDRRHPVRAASRPGLRRRHGFHGRHQPAAVFAAIIAFAVLPDLETFAGFSLVIGLVLVPAGCSGHGRSRGRRRCSPPWRRISCRCSRPPTR